MSREYPKDYVDFTEEEYQEALAIYKEFLEEERIAEDLNLNAEEKGLFRRLCDSNSADDAAGSDRS